MYSSNADLPQGSILGLTLCLPHVNHLLEDATCNIVISADDTYSLTHWSFILLPPVNLRLIGFWLWQQLEFLTYERWKTGAGYCLLTSMLKTQLGSWIFRIFLLMWKCVCLPLMKNHLLRCWDFSFSSKSDGGSDICFIAKTASKKIGAWTVFMKFLSSGSLLSQ